MSYVDLTIIIPAYNEAHVAEKALSALIAEAERIPLRIELIVVDDRSTDGTFEILETFGPVLKLLRTEKNSGGAGVPRNLGLDQAIGEYLCFYDLGDIINLQAASTVLQQMARRNVDLAVCKHIDIMPDHEVKHPLQHLFEKEWQLTNLNACKPLIANPFSWSKLYRVDFVRANNIRFGNQYCGEDKVFTWKSYLKARQILLTNTVMYGHRFFGAHVNRMLQQNLKMVESVIEVDRDLRDAFAQHGLRDLYDMRVLNRDVCGIILQPDFVDTLRKNDEYRDAVAILDLWLSKLIAEDRVSFKNLAAENQKILSRHLPAISRLQDAALYCA